MTKLILNGVQKPLKTGRILKSHKSKTKLKIKLKMKKLMTILGVFFFASIILTSCGGPEADAKTAECL